MQGSGMALVVVGRGVERERERKGTGDFFLASLFFLGDEFCFDESLGRPFHFSWSKASKKREERANK